jgi:hypothetical protein
MRDLLLQTLRLQSEANSEAPPVVGLEDYFEDNNDEECIAHNQVGYGRPSLADFYATFRRIQARDNVQTVLVGLHFDWMEAGNDEYWPAAENIHIYTSASVKEAEDWIAGLGADGILEGWPYGEHPSAPPLKPGYRVLTVCWD